MSNTDTRPPELACRPVPADGQLQVLHTRDVPLGGPRAMRVRRTLPQKDRSFIGAWCFADHYGPEDVTQSPGMDVPPHPHIGLQTVSWLFAGEIEHRDTGGVHALVRPGELNLMTSGRGIAHSEVSTPNTTTLHGVQLWVALPAAARDVARDFAHYRPPVQHLGAAQIRVFLGTVGDFSSPVRTHTRLHGAQLDLPAGVSVTVPLLPTDEYGILVDSGDVAVVGTPIPNGAIGYQPPGHTELQVSNRGTDPARVVLLGGEPYTDELVMWWNFVAGTHEEIVAAREEWQSETARFGTVDGYSGTPQRLPAPPLPGARLRPRAQPPTHHQEMP